MAISLISNPGNVRPAYNPIEYVFSSSNVGECDFVFILDLYVDGSFAVRLKAHPDPVSGYGHFNLERVLQDYLTFNFRHDITQFTANPECVKSYYVEVREKYNTSTNCTGNATLSSVLYTNISSPVSNFPAAWNGALQYKEYLDFSLNKYVSTDSNSKFLTIIPNYSLIPIDGYFVLSFLQIPSSSTVSRMDVSTYDSDYVLIATRSITNNLTDTHISIPAGPANLNAWAAAQSPPQADIITANVKYYSITLYNYSSPASQSSERKLFEIDSRCSSFKKYRIWWKNRLGSFDSYHFDLRSTKRIDITRDNYFKKLDNDYSEGDRGNTVISVGAQESYTFNSNFLTDKEAKWMAELFTSLEVYVITDAGTEDTIHTLGVSHNSGNNTMYLALRADIILPIGSTFTYEATDLSAIGSANSGSGTITGYDSGLGLHETDVPSSINASTNSACDIVVYTEDTAIIPLVITSNSYEEKTKKDKKNIQYTIEAKPSYKLNIPSS